MIIKKLSAKFGCLDNESLSFRDGLNIVTLPNEFGKSTWGAFILAMLYGIDTSQKDRQDHFADKNKYIPWSGGQMSGSMELIHRGREIRIERGLSGDCMRGFKAVYTDSGQSVPGLDAENAGEYLTGVGRAVYERSAFIRQDGMSVDSVPELELRLQMLVSAKDGSATFTDASKRLREWQRELRFNKSGELPRLRSAIAEDETVINALQQKGELLSSARKELQDCERELSKARQEVENHHVLAEYDRTRELARARMELLKAENAIKQRGARPVDRASLHALERLENEVLSLKAEEERSNREKLELLRKSGDLEVQVPGVFRGLTPAEAMKRAQKETADVVTLRKAAASKRYVLFAVLLLALCAALCVAAVYTNVGLYALVPAGAAFASAVLVFLRGRKNVIQILARINGLIDTYETTDFLLLARKYDDENRRAKAEAQSCIEAVEKYETARDRAKEAEIALLDEASRVLGGRGTLEEIGPAIQAAMASAEKNEVLTQRYEAAKAVVESLARSQKDDSGKYELKTVPTVKGTLEQAREQLALADRAREEALRAVSRLEGELKAAGDLDIIRARLDESKLRYEAGEQEYTALELALEALVNADGLLRRRFSPKLNQSAGEYFSALTGGRYESLYVEKNFNAGALESGEAVSRDKRSLSTGTVGQMYLAVRLAMCAMLGDGAELPPMILDDALCSFDDERMGLALETLRDVARMRQVILFTCQDREEAYLDAQMR